MLVCCDGGLSEDGNVGSDFDVSIRLWKGKTKGQAKESWKDGDDLGVKHLVGQMCC